MPTPLLLQPYQDVALAAVPAAALRGLRRQMLVMPPGAGKTDVFSELARRVVVTPHHHPRSWCTHRDPGAP